MARQKKGELLGLMQTFGFQAMLTGDRQMRYQQSWQDYPLPVLVLAANGDQYDDYNALIPLVKALLAQPGLAGGVHIIQVTPIS